MSGDASNGQSKIADRDDRGRFLIGNKTGPGRKRGSRARLAEDFLADLHSAWEEHGEAALKKCATTEPVQFCKIVANLMPAKMEATLAVTHELSEEFERASRYGDAWRVIEKAKALIGAQAPLIDLTPEAEAAWRTEDDNG